MTEPDLSAESVRVSIDPVQAVTCWTCDQDGLLIGIPETYDEALRLRANHLKSHHNDGQDAPVSDAGTMEP